MGKPPKRCLWQKKRGGFKEVSQWPVPKGSGIGGHDEGRTAEALPVAEKARRF